MRTWRRGSRRCFRWTAEILSFPTSAKSILISLDPIQHRAGAIHSRKNFQPQHGERRPGQVLLAITPCSRSPYNPPEDNVPPPLGALFPADLRQSPPHRGQLAALRLRLGQFLAGSDSLLETLRLGERPTELFLVECHLGLPLPSWTSIVQTWALKSLKATSLLTPNSFRP